jgi:RND superfamily putative drug exporter
MGSRLDRLGRWCARRHRYVIVAWLVLVIGAIAANAVAGGDESNTFTLPGTESQEASDVLEEKFPSASGTSATIAFGAPGGISSQQNQVQDALDTAKGLPDVVSVSNPFAQPPLGTVSEDGTVAYATVSYQGAIADLGIDATNELEDAVGKFRSDEMDIEFDGFLVVNTEPIDTGASEEIGLLVAIIVLLITLGAVLAMGVPIVSAIVGVGTGLAVIGLLANVLTIPSVAPAAAIMIGLGVGIDYSLFVVGRYRAALAEGLSPEEAAGKTTATSGRAVVTAGSTVVVALAGLVVFAVPAVSVIALAIGIVVVITVLSAVTLLPAVLGVIGHRVDWGRIRIFNRPRPTSAGHRWAALVTRMPIVWLLLAVAVLVVIALPMLSLELGPSDATDSPEDSTERKAYDLIADGFGPGYNNPFLGVIELPAGETADPQTTQQIQSLLTAIQQDADVAAVVPPAAALSNQQVVQSMFNQAGDTAIFQMISKSAAKDEQTPQLVERTRDTIVPKATDGTGMTVLIGGTSASYVDLDDRISERLILFIGLVIVISWLILGMVFRSVAIPLKAGVFNLLVIGAAYGLLVAVFQWGWGLSLLGVDHETPIVSYLTPIIFAVLFGLSMDYEVYIISRMQEEFQADGDPARAVRDGLGSAARMVIAAATIMFFVFFAFVLSPSIVLKMFGFGLAAAILVDAFIARMVLLPAVMRLLGHAAWWPGGRSVRPPEPAPKAPPPSREPTGVPQHP